MSYSIQDLISRWNVSEKGDDLSSQNTSIQEISSQDTKFMSEKNTSSNYFWTAVDEIPPAREGLQNFIQPTKFTAFTLSDLFSAELAKAPLEFTPGTVVPLEISLPNPDGTFDRFKIEESPILEPALAEKFPEIKTYRGQGLDDPAATVRFDLTPAGFHAQVLSPNGAFYIDPYYHLDDSLYISYFKQNYLGSPEREFHEHFDELDNGSMSDLLPDIFHPDSDFDLIPPLEENSLLRSGGDLRTYQLAVAATGEYTQFHGGTVAAGQAAIVTAINRVNGIYENELAVRLQLVANNDQLVYTNAATDPYSNLNAGALLSENQANVDTVIGNANYDVGHVFSTGGGGLARLGVVGITGQKARGETGQNNPVGDPFYVDYVAHELGHQFGGNHTFNGITGPCGGGNRNASTAYEPGSGTTIQAYAGICDSDNLQPNSDPYFHSISFDEMRTLVTTGVANAAATITPTGNTAPTVNAGADYTIPARTPFQLTATGSDPNGDTLTYNWEQRDLGPAQLVTAADNGSSPLFRSFNPTLSPTRTFPQLPDILNNTTTIGEKLPTTNRQLNFRATARDNRSGGGGVNTDDMLVTVVDTGVPFRVTSNNIPTTWLAGTMQTVTWDVAGTTAAPINAANVNIRLSSDGGNTFPTVLAANTPNDGSQEIVVPNINTSNARIQVEAVGNIFFDISDANFSISAPPPTVSIAPPSISHLEGNSGTTAYSYTVSLSNPTAIPISVNYTTNDGTAALGNNDYIDNDGTLTFNPGDPLSQIITVEVNGDTNFEPDENFTVSLINATNANLNPAASQSTGIIQNDDLNAINGTPGRDILTGTSGNDRITGFGSADILIGGAGNDEFVYQRLGDRIDTITDFQLGQDQIVFTELLSNLGVTSAQVGFQNAPQGAYVTLDADGAGPDIFRPYLLVRGSGVTPATLNDPANFIF